MKAIATQNLTKNTTAREVVIMNLINMINIGDERRERKSSIVNEKTMNKREFGYTEYESLEYVKNNHKQDSFKLQMEMMKTFIR